MHLCHLALKCVSVFSVLEMEIRVTLGQKMSTLFELSALHNCLFGDGDLGKTLNRLEDP